MEDEDDEEGVLKYDSSSSVEDSEEQSLGKIMKMRKLTMMLVRGQLLGTVSRFGRTVRFNNRIISKTIAMIY